MILEKEEKLKLQQNQERFAQMRGDRNYLFRAFSFILFGIQSYDKSVRETLVSFMIENQILFAKVENTPMEEYLSVSKMKEFGTWETELEILAFSSLCNTTVYVYCNCGSQGWR